jgi:carboxymethylenebutenolidase
MSGEWIGTGDSGRSYLALPQAGHGPGLALFDEVCDPGTAELYAAEGYVALCPERLAGDAAAATTALRARPECTGKIGLVGLGRGGALAWRAAAQGGVDAAVVYCAGGIGEMLDLAPRINCPLALHFAETDPEMPPASIARVRAACAERPEIAIYLYPGAARGFARRSGADYDRAAAGVAHSRSIALLRRALGPHYDLEVLWEAHTRYEFEIRDATATMATMVAEPYVNHVPVMTGGVGATDLARFYANHFIPKCPKDFSIVPISRTVGADRVVDEMLTTFTHDVEIDWMLPGVPPTGRRVEVAVVAIVGFRGDKLYREHIYWDQASVLVQIGLLDPKGLPVAGAESARKLIDGTRPSNRLMARWAESAPPDGHAPPHP